MKYETTRKELLAVVYGLKQFRQYLHGRHFVIRVDHAALSWLHRTAEPMPQLARWLTFIEQFDYEVEHRPGTKHGNADGLSRRPPVNEESKVRTIVEGVSDQVRETLRQAQAEDKEMGDFVRLRLHTEEPPNNEDMAVESETTKRLVTKWNEFRTHNGLVYREAEKSKPGEPKMLRLLVPRSEVDEVLYQCHAGTTAGHFGIRKTLDQVQRRFF